MKVKVQQLSGTACMPTKAHDSDAGWDVYADEDININPGETVRISTGIAIQLPDELNTEDEVGVSLVWDRGSMGSKGIHRLAGVVDWAYTGEVFICLTNLNISAILESLCVHGPVVASKAYLENTYIIEKGDKIAQILIQKVVKCDLEIVDELLETDRGEKCLGSSGK